MKPLPDLTDEAAMLLRGRLSTLGKARSETMIALRDAYTALDGCGWAEVASRTLVVRMHADRLLELAWLWFKTTVKVDEASMTNDQS